MGREKKNWGVEEGGGSTRGGRTTTTNVSSLKSHLYGDHSLAATAATPSPQREERCH